ncbi:unnamed protein product [Urochloa humidicola]
MSSRHIPLPCRRTRHHSHLPLPQITPSSPHSSPLDRTRTTRREQLGRQQRREPTPAAARCGSRRTTLPQPPSATPGTAVTHLLRPSFGTFTRVKDPEIIAWVKDSEITAADEGEVQTATTASYSQSVLKTHIRHSGNKHRYQATAHEGETSIGRQRFGALIFSHLQCHRCMMMPSQFVLQPQETNK